MRPPVGPLAEAGYGYCRYHGVTRIAPGAQRDALAAYVIRKLHSTWNTRKPPGGR